MDTKIVFVLEADPTRVVSGVKQTSDSFQKLGTEVQATSAKSKTAAESFQSSWVSASAKAKAALELEAEAFKRLGVTSTAELQKMADQARQAYAIIQTSGTASAGDVLRAQKASIEAQITLYKGMAQQVPAELEKQFSSVKQSLGEASSASSAFGNSLGSLKTIAIGVVGTFGAMAIANQIREWITAAADFQREFANVKTLFDESKVNAGAMRSEILSLSGALGSSVDLTKGLYEALSAGIAPANAVKFVGEAAMFAKAALVDTRGAVDVLTTVINAYGMKASDAARISDVLFTTIKLGKVTGDELSRSLGLVIGVASITGVKFEELNAAIATLTAGGIKTSQAVESLRSVISNIGQPTKEASERAEKLGINFSLAGLKSKGLAVFLQELTEKAGDNVQAQNDLFGSLQGFNAIATLTAEQGMRRFNDAMIQIKNSTGATTVAFEKQNDTVGAQSEALWNNISKLFTKAAGEGRSLTDVLKGINTVLESKTWGDAYLNFNKLTIQLGLQSKAARQALEDAKGHKAMMDAQTASTKRSFDAMDVYARSLLEAGKAQEKVVGEKSAAQIAAHEKALKEQATAAKKVHDEMEKLSKQYATVTGAALLQIQAIKEDIKFMEQHRGSTDALAGAQNKLEQSTLALIVAQSNFPELLKDRTVAHQTVKVAMLGEVDAVELLTMAYDKYRASLKAFTEIDFGEVMISNNATLDAARNLLDENLISLGKLNKMMEVETPKSLAPAKQSFEDMGKQISTIATDLSKGVAEALIKWKGFWESMKKVGQEFGTAITRTFMESMMEPLAKEDGLLDRLGTKLSEQFEKVGKKLQDFFGKLFDDISEFVTTSIGKIVGAIGGAALALAGYKSGSKAMGAAGGALMGASIGSFFGPWGTAIGAGVGAVGGFIAGAFGARGKAKTTATGGANTLSADAWGAVADVKAGNLTIQEGIDAVNAAWVKYEAFLRANVKDQTVIQRSLDSQRITLTASLAELNAIKLAAAAAADATAAELKAMTDELVTAGMKGVGEFLEKMKVGGVTDDILQGLKDIAAAMADTGREAETSAANLAVLGAEFLKTGKMTDQFAAALESAGGSADFFTEMTGEIQRLQGLRSELGSLKQMIDSLIPKQRTWQEEFFETGKITDAMAEKIREAGGDIEQFKKFADVRGVKTRFEQLAEEFDRTGVATQELLDLMGEFGGSEVKAAFQKLMDEAKASGKTVGQLGKDSETSAAAIQAAFESTSAGINTAFTNAAQKLSDALTKMDQNLSLAIQGLQTAMVTMIQDLINVILGVPGAAEKAAADANRFLGGIHDRNVKVTIQAQFEGFGGLDEYERRLGMLTNMGFAPGTVGVPIPTSQPTFPSHATGIDYVPKTGLALIHQGERIIPASENKAGTGGNVYHVTNEFNITAVDPDGTKKVVRDYIIPAITQSLQNNTGGSRELMNDALRTSRR